MMTHTQTKHIGGENGRKMSGMLRRLKVGEGLLTKDMELIGEFHKVTSAQARAILDLHISVGRIVETESGFVATGRCSGLGGSR